MQQTGRVSFARVGHWTANVVPGDTVVRRLPGIDPATFSFVYAQGREQFGWREPHARRHDRKAGWLWPDEAQPFPGLAAIASPRAERAAFFSVLLAGRYKYRAVVRAIHYIIGTRRDAGRVELWQ